MAKPLKLDDLAAVMATARDMFYPRRALSPDDGWFVQFKEQIYPKPSFDEPPPVPYSTFNEAQDACRELNAKLLVHAILTTIEQAGYRIVPVEATDEMAEGGLACWMQWQDSSEWDVGKSLIVPIYAAMIEASPKFKGE